MATRVRYREDPDADNTIRKLAAPQVLSSADAIARRIPENVPFHHGTSRRLFRQARARAARNGSAVVSGFPPHWHWFEYGTRWNPPYAPIRRTVQQLGMGYEAHGR